MCVLGKGGEARQGGWWGWGWGCLAWVYDQSKIGSEKEAINAQRGLAYSWRLRHRFKGLKRGILEVRFEL